MKKRGKLKGFLILGFLILLLGVIDSAWIFSYKKTISLEVVGGEKTYTFLKEFDDTLSVNTVDGPANGITSVKIGDLEKDMNVTFEISNSHRNLDADCSPYTTDCNIMVTYNNTATEEEKALVDGGSFLLLKSPIINILNYKIECVENSCSQKINSTITLKEVK